jgi:hypothetical protein
MHLKRKEKTRLMTKGRFNAISLSVKSVTYFETVIGEKLISLCI